MLCLVNGYMNKRKIGLILSTGSILVWIIDRASLIISTFLGQLHCGKRYMQPVDSIVGDASCGFNIDMYFSVFLFTVLLVGLALFITSKS
jgi:hypothetical protein